MSSTNGRLLMIIYSAGFVALFVDVHAAALERACGSGRRLKLGALEVYDARASVRAARHQRGGRPAVDRIAMALAGCRSSYLAVRRA